MLTATELSAMREIEESVLSSTGIIKRRTLTADGMGGYTESWAAVGTVDCDVWQISQRGDRERTTEGAQPISKADWFITVPYDTDLVAADRMEISSRTFEVTFVPNDSSWLTALRAEAVTYNEEQRL
jgi:head-tail adaptor